LKKSAINDGILGSGLVATLTDHRADINRPTSDRPKPDNNPTDFSTRQPTLLYFYFSRPHKKIEVLPTRIWHILFCPDTQADPSAKQKEPNPTPRLHTEQDDKLLTTLTKNISIFAPDKVLYIISSTGKGYT